MREYNFDGYLGCVVRRRARQTGRLVGIYNSEQAGMCTDSGKWSIVCEDHATIIAHDTLPLAIAHASDPLGWCEECREEQQ